MAWPTTASPPFSRKPIGMAATWDPALLHQEGHVIGIEGRAKFNDYASKHNGDSKWWAA